MNNSLDKEITAYNALKTELEATCLGKWVVFHDCTLQGQFDDFDSAAAAAVSKFGRGPYLIRQVGEQQVVLPASVVYSSFHAI